MAWEGGVWLRMGRVWWLVGIAPAPAARFQVVVPACLNPEPSHSASLLPKLYLGASWDYDIRVTGAFGLPFMLGMPFAVPVHRVASFHMCYACHKGLRFGLGAPGAMSSLQLWLQSRHRLNVNSSHCNV